MPASCNHLTIFFRPKILDTKTGTTSGSLQLSLKLYNILVVPEFIQSCWATVCKTVRPMLSVRCPVCTS